MEAEKRPLEEILLDVFSRCVEYSALDCPTWPGRTGFLSKKPTFAHFGKALFPPIDGGASSAPRTNLGRRHRFPQGFPPVESNHNT